MGIFGRTPRVTASNALPGRADAMPVPSSHYVSGHPIAPPFPEGLQVAQFGMGCFWGAERAFWELAGVYSTAVGYADGFTPNKKLLDRMEAEAMKGDLEINGKRYGLILDVGGYYKNVITLAPSLEITAEEIDLALKLLDALLRRCVQEVS